MEKNTTIKADLYTLREKIRGIHSVTDLYVVAFWDDTQAWAHVSMHVPPDILLDESESAEMIAEAVLQAHNIRSFPHGRRPDRAEITIMNGEGPYNINVSF